MKEWFALSTQLAQKDQWDKSLLDPTKMMGWLKHAIVMSFFCLQKIDKVSYDSCMELGCLLGGDTDTNCAIVGGMIGAYFGKSGLPQEKVQICLNCNLNDGTKKYRPEMFQPAKTYPERFEMMFNKCKSHVEIQDWPKLSTGLPQPVNF